MAPGMAAPHRSAYVAQHVLLLLTLVVLRRRRRRYIRTEYQHEINESRLDDGDFYKLISQLRHSRDGGARFHRVMRMTIDQFDWLVMRLSPHMQTKLTHRTPISSAERIAMTIRYLASGNDQASVALAFRVGTSTVNQIVYQTCNIIWDVLGKEFVKFPSNEEEWLSIAENFSNKWNFPHCIGALDGKHVTMQAPPHAGSKFFNYKKTHSIVLMAACDANYKFTFVDIGAPGRNSDGGVFPNTAVGQGLSDPASLHIPPPSPLNGSLMPFVFVGDEAFPLKTNLMRPYPGHTLPEDKMVYNYRLSRARRIIENTFGILVARWRIFKSATIASHDRLTSYVKAAVVLHNMLISAEDPAAPEDKVYCPPQMPDKGDENNGQWRHIIKNEGGSLIEDVPRVGSNNFSMSASQVRDFFKNYFVSDGAVSWQLEKVRRGKD